MKVLITSGATREWIDGVRFVTNVSTGRTGASIADSFSELGYEVTLLRGSAAVRPQSVSREVEFEGFSDLDRSLQHFLDTGSFGAVIHLAAVSDYSVAEIRVDGQPSSADGTGKLPSSRDVTIRLRSNFKIVDRLKEYGGRDLRVVGFKLTHTQDRDTRLRQILELSQRPNVDYVVHNELSEIVADRHPFEIFRKETRIADGRTKSELAARLDEILRR